MQDPASRLMTLLLESRSFEEVAGATLRLMLEVAEQVLAASRYAGRSRIIRGMIHLRPEEGYRGRRCWKQARRSRRRERPPRREWRRRCWPRRPHGSWWWNTAAPSPST
ncbi:hypothetical protein ACN28S_02415 [Cystobacter fuscus]